MGEKLDKVKKHVKDHKVAYIVGGSIIVAGITYLIVRDITSSQHIKRGIPVLAQRGIPVLDESVTNQPIQTAVFGKAVMNNVSYISANRQGPPSWVIRCVDTGDIFTSQAKAAIELGIPANELSRHLNGTLDNVRGLHFERICMAA
jgi:hypothetical protein